MNTTVTAKGMQVVATAESSLNIKVLAADNNTYGSEATVTMGASLKLKPTSTSNLTKFFKATAANYNDYAAIPASVEVVNADPISFTAQSGETGYFTLSEGLGYITTTTTSGTAPITAGTTSGDAYALVAGYNIKLTDGAANKGLAIPTIKVGGLTAALSNSIRVGVIMVDGNNNAGTPKIIAPSRTSLVGAGSPYSSTSATANPNPTVFATAFDATTKVSTLPGADTRLGIIGSDVVTVYIFVYFEGQDNNNTSYNYDNFATDNLNIEVTFNTYTET